MVRSNDNLIGTVYIDLSPLLRTGNKEDKLPESWHPIHSVENGLRGDLKVQVNVRFQNDENEDKTIQSTDVDFFCEVLPPLNQVKNVLRFVEELIEFKRRPDEDKYISERLNVIEAKSLRLRRKIAKKVVGYGGNAVFGYR